LDFNAITPGIHGLLRKRRRRDERRSPGSRRFCDEAVGYTRFKCSRISPVRPVYYAGTEKGMLVGLFEKLIGSWLVPRAEHDREMARLNYLIAQKEEELRETRGIVEKALRAASLVEGASAEQLEALKAMTELYLDKQRKPH
jgi:hypothetical protein